MSVSSSSSPSSDSPLSFSPSSLSLDGVSSYSWFRQDPYFAAFSQRSLLDNIMHHQQEPNNIRQSFNSRLLRLVGTHDPFRLFLDLEQMKKEWFFAQDTRQISKRKRFLQYVLDTHALERLYPQLEDKVDLIRMIINIYRQIQQEAFGIVLINQKNQVFLVQNEKYYWSFPKGKLKLNPETDTFESQWSCALREFREEVNVDLSDWMPSQYWEARMADQRMVGLFVIEHFDETKVQFDFDKREIIDIMWFNSSSNHDEMHTLRQYWKEQQRLSDPYYTALPFIEHLIFEYLPHKQQQQSSPVTQSSTLKTPSSSDGCSVIEMLLGRTPVCCHPVVTLPPLCNVVEDRDEGDVKRRETEEKCVPSGGSEDQFRSMNIVDRLNEAIRRAQCHADENNRRQTSDAQHQIVVQA